MKVIVNKTFKWAPDGIHVRDVLVGEVLEGRGAQVTLDMQCGEVVDEEPPAKQAEPPANKAVNKAPRNKGR